eukprot:1796279-Prymnesium_polylepis.2
MWPLVVGLVATLAAPDDAAATRRPPPVPPVPPQPPWASPWIELSWCGPHGKARAHGQCALRTAESELLRSKFCEALVISRDRTQPCPEQWFAYLETTRDSWTATFPQCDQRRKSVSRPERLDHTPTRAAADVLRAQFTPAQWSPQRNDFAIIGTTDVITLPRRPNDDLADMDDADSLKWGTPLLISFGAVMLKFLNTTSSDLGWIGMAKSGSCSLMCLSREPHTGIVRASTLIVRCPDAKDIAGGRRLADTSQCRLGACAQRASGACPVVSQRCVRLADRLGAARLAAAQARRGRPAPRAGWHQLPRPILRVDRARCAGAGGPWALGQDAVTRNAQCCQIRFADVRCRLV